MKEGNKYTPQNSASSAGHTPASSVAGGTMRFTDNRSKAVATDAQAPVAQLLLQDQRTRIIMRSEAKGMRVFDEGVGKGKYKDVRRDVMAQFARSTKYLVDFNVALSYAKDVNGFDRYLADKLVNKPEKFGENWQNAQDSWVITNINWEQKYEEVKAFYKTEQKFIDEEIADIENERDEVVGEDSEPWQKASYTRVINKLQKSKEALDRGMEEAKGLKNKAVEISEALVRVIRDPGLQQAPRTRSGGLGLPSPHELKGYLADIRTQLQVILDRWVGNAGQARSMSAKGRARQRDGAVKSFGSASSRAQSLFSLIKIDGASPDNVFEPNDDSYEAPTGVLTFGGQKLGNLSDKDKWLDHMDSEKGANDKRDMLQIAANIDQLPKPAAQEVTYTGAAIKKDRGSGQASAMLNTNAAAYAFAKGLIKKAQATGDWEWLHIRAASLGGVTDSTNLVPGLSDANTLMMPVESHINELSKVSGMIRRTKVRFAPETPLDSGGHTFRYIQLTWLVDRDPNPFAKEVGLQEVQRGEAKFDITQGRVVTKSDIELLEGYLKEKRNK